MNTHPNHAPHALAGTPSPQRPPSRNATAGTTPNSGRPEKIPSEWSWHHRTLLNLRNRLMRAHTERSLEAATPPETRGVDLAETTREQIDRDLLWAELATEGDKLFEVDCALQRMHDGVYGICEETGRPIPPDRLQVIPWTRYCRTAMEGHERRAGRSKQTLRT